MSEPTLERIERLFFAAADLTATARRRYLDAECADEPTLRARVERMLDAGDDDAFIVGAIHETARRAAAEETASWVGRDVGPYRITGEIGHGGMGTVYAAERADGAYEATVAIKIIRGAMAGGDAFRRFLAERKILAGLAHPNIARLLDAGLTEDGVPYMVMERVDGEPIDRYCDERCLTLEERLDLFVRVCQAVRFAHRGFVVHRDIKPANILVTADGEPKLLDFGIAKLLDADDDWLTRTATAAAVMTPAYASPEQLLGGAITQATDVYGLGLVLYELLTGVRAHEFADRSPREVDRVVCRDMPPRPASRYRTGPGDETEARARLRDGTPGQLRRALGGDLGTIVETALRKEPERRYPTVNALMEDLDRRRRGLPITARPDTPAYRIRRFVGRHPAGVATAVGAAVVVVAAGIGVFVQGVRAARERDVAELRREVAAGVSEFLVDAYGGETASDSRADPSVDILRRGEEQIAALEGRPAVQAGVEAAVGRLYLQAGRFGPARTHLEAALARRLALFGPDAGEVAASHQALGDLLLDAGEVRDAATHYREALRIRAGLLPPDDPDRIATRMALARTAAVAGEPGVADSLYRMLLPDVGPDHTLARADIFFALAELPRPGDDPSVARALADSAYTLRATLGPGHSVLEASRVQRLRLAPRPEPEAFDALPDQRFAAGLPTPFNAVAGDFNGDGRLDLVWNHRSDRNVVRVAFGGPGGRFRLAGAVDVAADGVDRWDDFDLQVGDFDGDGRDDLIWNRLARLNRWVVALSDGDGGFQIGPLTTHVLPDSVLPSPDDDAVGTRWTRRGLLVADFTGDGLEDLFWYDRRLLMAWVAVAQGGGRFRVVDVERFFPYGPAATEGVDVGETIDAAAALRGPDGVRIVRGRWEAHNEIRVDRWDPGRDGFAPPRVLRYDMSPFYIYNSVGIWHYYRLRHGDVDGDGLDDLIWVDPATPYSPADVWDRVYVARAQPGDPPFRLDPAAHQDRLTLGDPGPFRVHVGDFDGDGRADLLWDHRTAAGENALYVSYGRADGRFETRPGRFLHPRGGDWTRAALFVGDVDGDGRDDVVWDRTGALNRVYVALAADAP